MTRDKDKERAYRRHYYRQYTRPVKGHKPMRDAAPVRERLISCRAAHWTFRAMADTAGVNEYTIRLIHDGVTPRVYFETAVAILTKLDPTRPPVTPTGLTRRVRALAALGWSVTQIAEAADLERQTVLRHRAGPVDHIKPSALRLLDAYRDLSMRTPPQNTPHQRAAVTNALNHARRNKWVPPLAWDDERIDDPQATPAKGAVLRRRPGVFSLEDLETLVYAGETWENITRRLGFARNTIEKRLHRADRTDLLRILAERNIPQRRANETRWGVAS